MKLEHVAVAACLMTCACGDGDLDGHYAAVGEPFSYTLLVFTDDNFREFCWSLPCELETRGSGLVEVDSSSRRGSFEPEDTEDVFAWPRGDEVVLVERLTVELNRTSKRIHVDGMDVNGHEIAQVWKLSPICEG